MHRHHHLLQHRGDPLVRVLRAASIVILLLLTVAPAAGQEATPGATPVATPGATPLPAFPAGTPVPGASATPVLAYYSIRYNTDSWDRAKADFPALGRYPSDDPEIMRQHIRWAKAAGIDGFIVGWKNTEELTDRLRTLVQIGEEEEFKLVLLYEAINTDRNPVPAPRIAADLEYFVKELGDSRVFAIFSRPVVIWSGSWEFSREEIELVTPQLRERLLILASERNPDDYRDRADLFDGDAYYWSSANPKTYARYADKLKSMARAVHERGGLWIAPAAPGFDARLIGGDRAVSRDNGDMLRTQLSAAFRSEPDAIGLISWNEFSESSHIEPSCVYGVTSLEVLASMLGGTAPASVPCGSAMTGPTSPTPAPAATALSQFSIEEAESTIAIAEEATALPAMGNIDVDPRPRAPSAGAPTVRFATIALLVVFGGFVGGCTMVMVLRSKRTPQT